MNKPSVAEKGDNLSNFIAVIPVGKQFVEFREELEQGEKGD